MKESLRQIYRAVPFKKELFSVVRAFYRPPKSVYQHLHFKGVFSVPVGGSSFLLKHYGMDVENTIFWEGLESSWEGTSLSLWSRLCEDAQVILDVGANTGVYSLVAKAVNPRARVIAFEPVRRVFEKLEANCKLNGYDIECVEKALSNSDGKAKIYDVPSEHVYSVTVNRNLHDPGVPVIETEIETIRLSRFMETHPRPFKADLIKLDVETHEPEVLEGMGACLERDRPAMLVEILDDEVARRVEALVAGKGYLYYNIPETGTPRRQDRLTRSDDFNFLLCDPKTARKLGLA
jgi:FkbM family methyltransferase